MNRGCDMIAGLQNLAPVPDTGSIQIKQAYPTDRETVMDFITKNFHKGWALEAEYSMFQQPRKCFIAVENGQILGFSCYDASAKGFFGPIGVQKEARGKNIGTALLLRTLHAMKEFGYGYAVIGWVDSAEMFYRKTVGAEFIPGGEPQNSVYKNMIDL